MKTIIPIDQKIVWKQYAKCDDSQRAWIAVMSEQGKPAGKSPFGDPMCELNGLYRLNINGELQPVRKYTTKTLAGRPDEELREIVLARAITDLWDSTESHCQEDLKCWHCKILSNNSKFLRNIGEDIKEQRARYFDLETRHSSMSLNGLRTITLAHLEPSDEKEIFDRDDVAIY